MGDSYRIKTELGINKSINIQLDQEFEFLEILSLKIQQTDIYTRSCADYGVLVGRVTANNGFGIPNARVSIFIPIEQIDESNPLITSIYPYKSPNDKNEDGYRYNLLPYEKSYSKHAATGTLPSRSDVLTGSTAVEIYDKYYRYTTKTNESGDYMIMGVPLGDQTVVMDVDLSDIGEFSLTPQDLIRMGLATQGQVGGNQFRTSNDLASLPQLVNLTKNAEISPLWGDPEICQISINRLDFDLRDDANIDIQPTAVFMGSLISTADSFRLRRRAKPRDNMGNLCDLTTGPGQILAIRQTIQQDEDGNPVLEVYQLEQAGNVIDGNGTWLTEMPMNLDYFITNEFGEKVLSNDPTVGIPTKAKYRFKIKWAQPNDLSLQTRRPYYLVPNIKEYGWTGTGTDPNTTGGGNQNQLKSSYYFGLEWSGYTQGFTGQDRINRLNEAIDCEDTFYEFQYNRVYTISGLIDEFKNGGRGRFIGIKEIDDQDCENTVNKFPVNDGFRNFDFLFFVFALLMQIIQLLGLPILVIYHFLAFLWNNFAVPILIFLIGLLVKQSVQFFVAAGVSFPALGLIVPNIALGILCLLASIFLITRFRDIVSYKFGRIKLPMITYPDCQACECDAETTAAGGGATAASLLTQFSNPGLYYEGNLRGIVGFSENDSSVMANLFSQAMGGRSDDQGNNSIYKTTIAAASRLPDTTNFLGTPKPVGGSSTSLPMGERINVFNGRKKYFDGINRMSVTFDYNSNIGSQHLDNTITVVTSDKLPSGTLLTFVNPTGTTDVNFLYTADTVNGLITGISGTPKVTTSSSVNVSYANPQNQTQNLTQQYILSSGSTGSNYRFPADLEYYQVVTAFTISEIANIWNPNNPNLLPGILNSCTNIRWNIKDAFGWQSSKYSTFCTKSSFTDFSSQYITILQRGVDPYSPTYTNRYGIGKILGLSNENDFVLTANTRLNIPIQRITSGLAVQQHNNQSNIFYPSYFFNPGIDGSTTVGLQYSSYTTSNVGYYSRFDANFSAPVNRNVFWNGLRGVVSSSANDSYNNTPSPENYDGSEDLSGVGLLNVNQSWKPTNTREVYYAPSLYSSFVSNPLQITSKVNNVMRTDRLPNSDFMDGSAWSSNAAALQQNLGFATYIINTDDEDFTTSRYNTGADTVTADIEGQLYENEVITSLNTCSNMVGLGCYSGFGGNFGVNVVCKETDPVQNGCYILVEKPLKNLGKDFKTWSEWGYRFRFFYGLCRGVLSQSFVNNWVNGTLYTFPIQVDTFYDRQNKPLPPRFTKELVHYDSSTNNFYYRSSPYLLSENKFIGRPTSGQVSPVNRRNLLFPTTIINLGMKDYFYQEIMFEPSTRSYIMNSLDPTSYSDTSDLVNLFVISRITDEKFLQRIFAGFNPNNSLDQLFSRPSKRIDGDLAQAMSINSEFGVIPFSPEYYAVVGQSNAPVVIEGTPNNPTMGIFFSSTTQDLQNKDYVSPGIINFRPGNNLNALQYPYELKSQRVPFYQWGLNANGTIFGNERNEWETSQDGGIISYEYQGLNRRFTNTPSYFSSSNNSLSDIYQRGYIFNIDQNQNYSINAGTWTPKFVVGAPFHFYFGLIKGESALDKFKEKFSVDE